MREQFEAAQAADAAIRNRAAARPTGNQLETRAPKDRAETPKAARLNLSLAMDDSNPTAQRMAQERAAEQIEAIARKAAAEVMMQMFPGLYDEHTPQVVRELQHNVFEGPLPKVFTMDEHMCYWGDSGGGLAIAGTPELFKVCALTGWTLDSEGEWTQMSISAMVASPPTTLWSGQTEAGNYLRPTWDWVRAYEDD